MDSPIETILRVGFLLATGSRFVAGFLSWPVARRLRPRLERRSQLLFALHLSGLVITGAFSYYAHAVGMRDAYMSILPFYLVCVLSLCVCLVFLVNDQVRSILVRRRQAH